MAVADQDEVTILIDGKEFSRWPSVDITLSIDTFSTVSFTAPFEADRKEFREIFRPFTYKSVEVLVKDGAKKGSRPQKIFTGTFVGIDPEVDPNKSVVSVTCYALPAVLNDCNAPGWAVPTEYKNLSLLDISNQLASKFDLLVESIGVGGSNFTKVKLDIEETPFSFLSELARQRGAIISDTPEGFLRLWKAVKTGDPVARLAEGSQPVLKVAAAFSPQEYYSEITGFGRAKRGKRGGKYTLQNPLLFDSLNPIRPKCFAMGDTEPGDVPAATTARMSRMFGNVASYTIDLATWRDPQGDLWDRNTTVMLAAPQAMIYGEFEFLVRTVTFHQDENSSNAQLGVVLPGAFSDELPKRLPWED